MPLAAEVWTTKIRTCAAVLKCMLIQLGSLRSSIALLPGLMGPRAKTEEKNPQKQQASLAASVRCRTHGPPSGCSTRDCYRDGEKEREREKERRAVQCVSEEKRGREGRGEQGAGDRSA